MDTKSNAVEKETLMNSIERLATTRNKLEGLAYFSQRMVDKMYRAENKNETQEFPVEEARQETNSVITLLNMINASMETFSERIERNIDDIISMIE